MATNRQIKASIHYLSDLIDSGVKLDGWIAKNDRLEYKSNGSNHTVKMEKVEQEYQRHQKELKMGLR